MPLNIFTYSSIFLQVSKHNALEKKKQKDICIIAQKNRKNHEILYFFVRQIFFVQIWTYFSSKRATEFHV